MSAAVVSRGWNFLFVNLHFNYPFNFAAFFRIENSLTQMDCISFQDKTGNSIFEFYEWGYDRKSLFGVPWEQG